MSEFDAILVGAGHNSLACAAHLALKGWKIAVFERNADDRRRGPDREYTLPGFRHDFGAMNLSLFAGSAFHRKYANELKTARAGIRSGGRLLRQRLPRRALVRRQHRPRKDGGAASPHSPPADAETWRRLVGGFPGEAEHLFRLLGSPMSGARARRHRLERLAQEGRRRRARHGAAAARPRRAPGSTRLSSPPHVKATLAAWGMHLDFAPDIAGGAVFPYLESMANQSFGMVLGKGGADTMIRALEGMLDGGRRQDLHRRGGRRDHRRPAAGRPACGSPRARPTARRKAVIAGVAPGALAGKLLPDGLGRRRLRRGDEEIPPCAGHDDDPSGARRPARLDGRRRASGSSPMSISRRRSTPWRGPISRRWRACCRTSRCWSSASRPRSTRRARRRASMCSGCRCACCRPRSRAMRRARSRRDHWDDVKERYADRVLGMIEALCAGPARQRSSAARCSRRSTSSARTRTWSAATRSAAAITSVAEFPVPARRAASRAGTRRSRTCILSAPRLGRAPAPAQARDIMLAQQLGGR